MITSPTNLEYTLEDLESLFNNEIGKELASFKIQKANFVNPQSISDSNDYPRPPETQFQIWLKVDRGLVSKGVLDKFKSNIESAGWVVSDFEWQMEQYSTRYDTLYITVELKNTEK